MAQGVVIARGPDTGRSGPQRIVRRLVDVRANTLTWWADALAFAVTLLVAQLDALALVLCAASAACLFVTGGYDFRLHRGTIEQVPFLLGRIAAPTILLAPLALATHREDALLAAAAVLGVTLLAARTASSAAINALRRRGHGLETTVLVGGGEIASQLATVLLDHPELGLAPVGHVDTDPSTTMPVPHVGTVAELEGLVRTHGVDHLVVAFPAIADTELAGLLRLARRNELTVHVVPRFRELGLGTIGPDVEDAWGIPLRRLRPQGPHGHGARVKRMLDVVAGSALLVLTLPVMLICAVAVRMSSPGPVLFRQRRVGQHGIEFELLKFRSMRVNDDSDITWNVAGDARLTRVGRILRATCLDELPQLLNVLRGEMSLVGPRPERRFFVEKFSREFDGYAARHRFPVGLTGWAQVNGLRGDTSIVERTRFDNHYIDHWSLWRDLTILLRTVGVVLRRHPS